MRKIRFRGKTRATAEWVYGSVVTYDDGAVAMCSNVDGRYEWRYVEPTTVGQYTGMDDDDGEEIYEDDILIAKDVFGDEKEYIVAFDNNYHHAFGLLDKDGYWFDFREFESMTIIGNIHDNPEFLIKEKRL